MVTVGADMVDILQPIDAEGDQTASPGWVDSGGCGWGREERGSIRTMIS